MGGVLLIGRGPSPVARGGNCGGLWGLLDLVALTRLLPMARQSGAAGLWPCRPAGGWAESFLCLF